MNRVILFVDASNLYHSIKRVGYHPATIDYLNLFERITNKKEPNVRFYTAMKPEEAGVRQQSNQQSFHAKLKANPNLIIRLGKLHTIPSTEKDVNLVIKTLAFCSKCITKAHHLVDAFKNKNRFKEKGVDVKIVVDLITMAEANEYDVAILLSGDADLVPAIEFVVNNKKKTVINAYFDNSGGKELRDACTSQFRIKQETIQQCIRK